MGTSGPPGPQQYLSRSAVARLLGVSPNTVSRWAREGRIECRRTLGGHRRFDRAAIEDLSRRLGGRDDSGR
jgi:excisionase family DNA binding protein